MLRVSASAIAIICLVGLTQASNSQSAIFNSDPKKNWAVLVAGSDGWWNYRHQSDVCHAYQLLTGLGIPRENIITFMYDDIANNRNNPYPGKIFNDYNHKDVYAGVQIDYKGSDVNPGMFMRVMKGDAQLKAAGKKVLQR
ncbi:legumain [Paragonimus westermani]|uniref:Legumain n=1 Tax=Paragonimus westermani TaxID=34504 RepID=A0A5J4NE32_9TREM|nr:legumain [Paragonimus westermani]